VFHHVGRLPPASIGRVALEGAGTCVLTLAVIYAGSIGDDTGVLAVPAILSALIFALGPSCGAEFNPAVTLALSQAELRSWSEVVPVLIAQVAGAGAATLLGVAAVGAAPLPSTPQPTPVAAAVLEAVYVCVLCAAVLNLSMQRERRHQYLDPLVAPAVVLAACVAIGWSSGACLNPAIALTLGAGGEHWLLFVAAQLAGGAAAVYVVQGLRQRSVLGVPFQTKLLAEAFGTAVLVATVCLSQQGGSKLQPLAVGGVLLASVASLGDISGAHFNPMVTMCLMLHGSMSRGDGFNYIGVQLAAACAAAWLCCCVGPVEASVAPVQLPSVGLCGVEVVFGGLLALVVLRDGSSDDAGQKAPGCVGVAVSGCVVGAGLLGGPVGGGILNPAVAVGLDLGSWMSGGPWGSAVGFTMLGAVSAALATALFSAMQPSTSTCPAQWVAEYRGRVD